MFPSCFVIASSTKLGWKLLNPKSGEFREEQPHSYRKFLSKTAFHAVSDRMDHVIVDLVGNFAGEMRCSVRHSFTRKRGGVLGAEKRRAHGSGEYCNESFHLSSLLSI